MTRRSLLLGLGLPVLASLTFAVAACSGDDASSQVSIPPGALVVYAGPGLVLDKAEYTIASTNGQVVIAYENRDTQRHTLVVKDAAGVIIGEKLEVLKNGSRDLATFGLTPGTYTVYCDVPGHSAMKATLIVT